MHSSIRTRETKRIDKLHPVARCHRQDLARRTPPSLPNNHRAANLAPRAPRATGFRGIKSVEAFAPIGVSCRSNTCAKPSCCLRQRGGDTAVCLLLPLAPIYCRARILLLSSPSLFHVPFPLRRRAGTRRLRAQLADPRRLPIRTAIRRSEGERHVEQQSLYPR